MDNVNSLNRQNLSYQQMAATLSCIGDSIIITDTKGTVTYINPAAQELTGWYGDTAIDACFDNVFPLINHETEEPLESPISIAIKQGSAVGLPQQASIKVNGEIKYVSASCSPIITFNKELTGVVVVSREITRIKKMEEQLQKSNDFLNNILDGFPALVWRDNVDMEMIYVNRHWCDFTGDTLEEALKDGWSRNIHPDDFENCIRNYNACVEKRKVSLLEYRLKRYDGEYRWVLDTGKPFYDMDGKFSGYIGMVYDITDRKAAEEGKMRYEILSEHSREIILFFDMDGYILDANKAALNAYGYSREELCSFNIRKLRASGEISKEFIEKAFKEGVFLETRHYRSDGRIFPVEISSLGAVISGKRIIVSIIRDISERKKAEALLRDSQAKYQSLFFNMNDAFAFHRIIFNDRHEPADIELMETNAAFCKMFNYVDGNFIGKRLNEVFPEFSKKLMPLIQKSYLDPDPGALRIDEYQSAITGRWFSLSGFFPFDGYFATLVTEITEMVKSNIEINSSRQKYQKLIMNMDNGFGYFSIITDNEGQAVDCSCIELNDAFLKITGLKREDIIGKSAFDTFLDFEVIFDVSLHILQSIISWGENYKVNEYYMKETGKWCSIFTYSPEPGYFAIVLTDITEERKNAVEMRKAKAQAEAANKAKSEFLANMSHEIRTPLNGITGMIDLTIQTELTDEQKENLKIAKNCAGSLLNIINDILDFSKMEAGKLSIENIDFSIKGLIDETIKAHSVCANDKGLELSYSFSSSVPEYLAGDPNRIQQVLNNLISNAVKFTEKGEVAVSVKRSEAPDGLIELQISVTDTGIGISEVNLDRLFKSFSQVDASFTRRYGGTGLGLVISKQLAEIMGGRMWVESREGKGSTFYFTVRCKAGRRPPEAIVPQAACVTGANSVNILLAEDDHVNQLVLSRMLTERGHFVDIANNGIEALKAYENKNYDVILMDIQMPEMDGLETTRRIRAKEGSARHTAIIALTAFALQGDRERFLAIGMDDYIPKPVRIDDLFCAIDKAYVNSKKTEPNVRVRIDENGELVLVHNVQNIHSRPKEELMSYISDITDNMNQLSMDIDSGDFSATEFTAHKLKVLFNDIDAEELKGIAFRIEPDARRGNLQKAVWYMTQLSGEFETYKKSIDL